MTTPNKLLRLKDDGTLLYTMRWADRSLTFNPTEYLQYLCNPTQVLQQEKRFQSVLQQKHWLIKADDAV